MIGDDASPKEATTVTAAPSSSSSSPSSSFSSPSPSAGRRPSRNDGRRGGSVDDAAIDVVEVEGCCGAETDDGPPAPSSPDSGEAAAATVPDVSVSGGVIPPFVLRAAAVASLGGVLFGYDMGVVSGALPQLSTTLGLSDDDEERVVGYLYLGMAVGSACGGVLCDRFGRRTGILATDVVFVMGAAVLSLAGSLSTVLLGRFVVGFAVSVSGICDVSYLTEVGPSGRWRGALVSCNEACISLGFLLSYLTSYALTRLIANHDYGWRVMFGTSGFIALAQFWGMWHMPESHVWLRSRGRSEEARVAVARISHGGGIGGGDCDDDGCVMMVTMNGEEEVSGHNGGENDDDDDDDEREGGECSSHSDVTNGIELSSSPRHMEDRDGSSDEIHVDEIGDDAPPTPLAVGAEASLPPPPPSHPTTHTSPFFFSARGGPRLIAEEVASRCSDFSRWCSRYRRQVAVAAFLAAAQQFCGHANVLNFAPEIFADAGGGGGGGVSPLASTVLLGVVKFVVTVLVIWRVDVVGRRPLLLGGIATICVSLVPLVVAFRRRGGGENNDGPPLAVIGAVGVVIGYAASFGPLTWLITSEMFPTSVRGRALGASAVATSACAYVVTYTLLSDIDDGGGDDAGGGGGGGASTPFVLYLVASLGSLAFALVAVPDTGKRSPSQIEDELGNMWMWRPDRFSFSSLGSYSSVG